MCTFVVVFAYNAARMTYKIHKMINVVFSSVYIKSDVAYIGITCVHNIATFVKLSVSAGGRDSLILCVCVL